MSKLKTPKVPDARVQVRLVPTQQSFSDAQRSVETHIGLIWARSVQGQLSPAEKAAARAEVLKMLCLE